MQWLALHGALWLLAFWVGLVLALLNGCVAPFRDADIDLKALTQPDPIPVVQPPAPPPPLSPPARTSAPATTWRAWVPRQVTPNGDVTAGHFLDVSPHEPAVEVLQPEKPMPRVPKHPMPKPAPASAGGAVLPGSGSGRQPAPSRASHPQLGYQGAPVAPGFPGLPGAPLPPGYVLPPGLGGE